MTSDNYKKIDEICTLTNGNGFKPVEWSDRGYPIIRIQNLNGSREFNYYDKEPKEQWIIENGDLLFAWAGVKGVSFGPTIWNGPTGVLNQHIYKIVPKEGVNKIWLYSILRMITSQIESKAHGFKSSLLHVQKHEITSQVVRLPDLCEQYKIAEIIETWDEAIDLLEKLITAKRKLKQGLMQQLLTGKRRFREFKDYEWKRHYFKDVFRRITRKNKDSNVNVLTISGIFGLISQTEFFNKRIAATNIDNYYLIKKGEFAYNKSYSNGYPLGAIKRLDRYEEGVLSTLYICFGIDSPFVNGEFMSHYFEAGIFNHEIYGIAQEGARNHGLLNISVADFFELLLRLPSLPEQDKIAVTLSTIDNEISTLDKQLTLYKQQKRGLMQQLLTGKKRLD